MSGSWITQDRLLIAVVTGVMGVLPACVEDTPTTVESDDDPPSVNITAPARNSAFSKGDVIEFAATVEDATDGTLTGGNLVWSSDLDGELGTGTPLAVSRLRTGVHVVTLLARDYNSGLAANEVTVFVYPVEYGRVNQAPEITITRPQSDEVFPVGEEIVFEGYGIDPEEGPMPDDELRWSLCSSLTSRCTSIGLGPRQTKTDLAPLGRYSVTLEATGLLPGDRMEPDAHLGLRSRRTVFGAGVPGRRPGPHGSRRRRNGRPAGRTALWDVALCTARGRPRWILSPTF